MGRTLAGQGAMSLKLLFGQMTNNLLADCSLGNFASFDFVASSQTLLLGGNNSNQSLLPGMYLYAYSGSPLVTNMIKFAMQNFGNLIEQIVPSEVGKKLSFGFGEVEDILDGSLAFGLWINLDSVGFSITFPPAAMMSPTIGSLFGKLTLTCKMKLTTKAFLCGAGYDTPRWLAAVWDGLKLVWGNPSYIVDDAWPAVEKKVGHLLEQSGDAIKSKANSAMRGINRFLPWSKKNAARRWFRPVSPLFR